MLPAHNELGTCGKVSSCSDVCPKHPYSPSDAACFTITQRIVTSQRPVTSALSEVHCCIAGTIVGISLAIICVLFLIQRFGTRIVGSVFSPVILLWLLCNAIIGIYNVHAYGAGVFKAFGPNYWFAYLLRNGSQGWKSLGGIVLCITGTVNMVFLRTSCAVPFIHCMSVPMLHWFHPLVWQRPLDREFLHLCRR